MLFGVPGVAEVGVADVAAEQVLACSLIMGLPWCSDDYLRRCSGHTPSASGRACSPKADRGGLYHRGKGVGGAEGVGKDAARCGWVPCCQLICKDVPVCSRGLRTVCFMLSARRCGQQVDAPNSVALSCKGHDGHAWEGSDMRPHVLLSPRRARARGCGLP